MLEQLKNQNRLSTEEENRIDRRIRIGILVLMGALIAFMIWVVVRKKPLGTWYYAMILTTLAVVWFVKCVLSAILKHALAQRTDEQVSAYLKASGLELIAYAGLAWFLVGLNGNGMFGAVAYMIGVTGARKQRESYEQEDASEEEAAEEGADPDAAKTTGAENPALPSAADRELREKEPEDGSV